MSEGEVILRMAAYLLSVSNLANRIEVRIDGEHNGHGFSVPGFMKVDGWERIQPDWDTEAEYTGYYTKNGRTIVVKAGRGPDVVMEFGPKKIVIECKRLRQPEVSLRQALGQLLTSPNFSGANINIVSVPLTAPSLRWAQSLAKAEVSDHFHIKFALVDRGGRITWVPSSPF